MCNIIVRNKFNKYCFVVKCYRDTFLLKFFCCSFHNQPYWTSTFLHMKDDFNFEFRNKTKSSGLKNFSDKPYSFMVVHRIMPYLHA